MTQDSIVQVVNEVIREEARPEAIQVLTLTTDKLRDEFMNYYKKDQHNVCCLVIDNAKHSLVKEGKMTQNNDDHFGWFPYDKD